ncbi:MAG: NAD-dependent epimerase/dehydratase family protein [Pseudomonadota bacterium]
MKKTALVCGAGGFIGSHLVRRLKADGFLVHGADLKYPEFEATQADFFSIGDLRDQSFVLSLINQQFDEVYQLAADMGGAGYLFTGENDANIMASSALINLNVLGACRQANIKRILYSSSACVYPEENQSSEQEPVCVEHSVYPANPDSEYGWEKLFAERLYLAHNRNHEMECRIARYHNIFGPMGTFRGGREKAPAALCRKVAEAPTGGQVEVWGDGAQTRSFLFIDECVEATVRLMRSSFVGPVNIGSEEMLSINDLARMAIDISGKDLQIINIAGPVGVRGRRSDNNLIREKLSWQPHMTLRQGMEITYRWIASQMADAEA